MKKNKLPLISVVICLLILFSSFSISFAEKSDSLEITLYPGESRILELDADWKNQNHSALYEDVVPSWLQDEFEKTLDEMQIRPIDSVPGTSISSGRINGDERPDLLLTGPNGSLKLYLDQTGQGREKFIFSQMVTFEGFEDVLLHPAVGREVTKNQLFFSSGKNVYQSNFRWDQDKMVCSNPVLIYESTKENDSLIPSLYRPNYFELVIGHQDGTLSLIQLQDNSWKEVPSFFPNWTEVWDEENPDTKGVVVSGRASPFCYWENEKIGWLLVGDQEGAIHTFRIQADQDPVIFQSYPLVTNWQTFGNCSPLLLDVQGDSCLDLVFSSSSGTVSEPISFLTNYSHDTKKLQFNPSHSGIEESPIGMFFGGIGFKRDYETLYANSHNLTEIKTMIDFLLTVPSNYIDEVVFCITHFQTEDLLIYIRQDLLSLLVENARSIEEMCGQVQYARMKQYPEYSTLEYATEKGFIEMPRDIYYEYLVMLNRYIMSPNAYKTLYQGNFYRTFLPTDTKYGITLLERVKEAKTLYEAAYLVDFWLKQDVGGIWHTGEKPRGWYNIYQNLLNKDLGIWCGEWSIIYEAAARAMNIPTIIIVALGEDHQFNNFWADGWHHVDSSSGEGGEKSSWKPYFDDSLIYYKSWGKRIFSWPMCWEANGKYDHVWRSALPYNPEELLTDLAFVVRDEEGQPLDGSRVELWSHWPMEGKYQPIPFISAIGYADCQGVAKIEKVGHQRFTVYVISQIGTVSFPFSMQDGVKNKEIQVKIPGKKPFLQKLNEPSQSYTALPEKESFSIKIDPNRPNEAFLDKKTNSAYAETTSFLKSFKNIDWATPSNSTMVIEFQDHRIVFHGDEKYYEMNGEKIPSPVPVWIRRNERTYLHIRTITELYGAKLTWDGKTQTITITWYPSAVMPIAIECQPTHLEVFPWIDVYYTQLRYKEFWASEFSPLLMICTNQAGVESFKKGQTIKSGFYQKIKQTSSIQLKYPAKEKQYIIVHNPSLSAICRFTLKK